MFECTLVSQRPEHVSLSSRTCIGFGLRDWVLVWVSDREDGSAVARDVLYDNEDRKRMAGETVRATLCDSMKFWFQLP